MSQYTETVKPVDENLYGLYQGDHLLFESPTKRILEAMKREEMREGVE